MTTKQIAKFLNEALATDRNAIQCLFLMRMPCNKSMRDHPTIQVTTERAGKNPCVGFVGLLNGLISKMDHTHVLAYEIESDNNKLAIKRFLAVKRNDCGLDKKEEGS